MHRAVLVTEHELSSATGATGDVMVLEEFDTLFIVDDGLVKELKLSPIDHVFCCVVLWFVLECFCFLFVRLMEKAFLTENSPCGSQPEYN